jgi:3'-phosphoadenosine 5'-phosphosulfate (PAPS) 3'-phosphatase
VIEQGYNKSAAGANRWWTLDPIDGTQGFLRRGQYAVALALMESM